MAVRSVGGRFFPVKKSGTLWKTGFSSKAKAEAAMRQNKARLSKLTGRGGEGGRKPGKGSSGNPSPASPSHNSKKMTHTKFMKGMALGGGIVRQSFVFAETGDVKALTEGLPQMYAGINPADGSFDANRLTNGYAGAVIFKGEGMLFKGAGVRAPPLKPKNAKDFLRLLVYHGSAVANASGGSSPRDKFERFYESHYGVKLGQKGLSSIDLVKVATEKWIPYIAVNKLMAFIK